jgi:4-hydroxy-tetrahydrodipicolinate synthase
MDKSTVDWHGVMPAIVTPFDRQGNIDEAAFRRHIDINVGYGVTGVVVTGCAGEAWALSIDERKRLFTLAMDAAQGRIKVIAATGSIRADEVIDMNRHAKDAGCDGAMVLAPFFPKLHSPDDLVAHYQMISDAVDLPIMLYNVPGYNVNEMTPDIISRLADINAVVAIKESTTDWEKFYRGFELVSDRIHYLTGQLSLYGLAAVEHGVLGTVTGATNCWGGESVEFFNACLEGDKEKALRLQKKAVDLWDLAMANHRNLYPAIKAMMNLQGLPGGHARPPLRTLGEPDLTELRDGLISLGFTVAAQAAE